MARCVSCRAAAASPPAAMRPMTCDIRAALLGATLAPPMQRPGHSVSSFLARADRRPRQEPTSRRDSAEASFPLRQRTWILFPSKSTTLRRTRYLSQSLLLRPCADLVRVRLSVIWFRPWFLKVTIALTSHSCSPPFRQVLRVVAPAGARLPPLSVSHLSCCHARNHESGAGELCLSNRIWSQTGTRGCRPPILAAM